MYDFIIIGSGIGGSTVFKELNNKHPDKKILLLEKGDEPKYVAEGNDVQVLYLNSLGGSALYSVGNAIRIDLKYIGIKEDIYDEIEKELNVNPVPMDFINETTKKLFDYGFKQTPKYINFNKCNSCGMCASRLCHAKWTPRDFLKQYKNSMILHNFEVLNIKKENELFFVEGFNSKNNKKMIFKGKTVIVSAGGVNSPRILSSILDNEHLGKNLFVDTFITVGGFLEGANLNKSVPMSVYRKYNGFLLSPHYSILLYDEIKKENKDIKNNDVFGLMIKIKDENNGVVGKDYVYKNITEKDEELLSKGFKEALNILSDIGVNNMYKTIPRGSHPSGTCAVGKVVNKDFETEIDGLFVCDASVFPESLGLPPILGIIAIGKKLANCLQ
ncbi:GMC oxidoreductase [Methanothermococcus sp. Ax23]|uniref:GMC oxidoreductase n=1 Tax=Methanothermococcus sp. Ax23 TaxID=3156486 RepID=UPI003BA0FEFB